MRTSIPFGQPWVRRAGTLHRRLPDGVMVLGPADTTGEPLAVRGPAAAVWELLERPTTAATLTQTLAALSGAPPEQVRPDVVTVLDRLAAAGAIEAAATHRSGCGSRVQGLAIHNQFERLGFERLGFERLGFERVEAFQLEGLLADAIETGAIAVTEPQREQAFSAHRQAMARALVLDRELLDLSRRFADETIDHRVLKGPAVAHLDYDDASLRPYRDVDVLVRPADIERARDVLLDGGGERRFPEPRPGYDRRFGKGMCVVLPSGTEIDVHRTLALGPFGLRVDLDDLWQESELVTIGDRQVRALDRHRRFLHAAYHAVLGGGPAPLALFDVAVTAPQSDDDVAAVLDLATRWQGRAVVSLALDRARDLLDAEPAEALRAALEHPRPSRREQRWLKASSGDDRSSAKLALAGIGALPWHDRPAYLAAIAFPRQSRRPWSLRWRRGVRAVVPHRRP